MEETNEILAAVQEDSQEDKYLTFKIGKEEYAIDIQFVTEIIGIQKITDLPDVPVYVKGVINLRGKVIPVIEVRLRFGFEERPYDERTCIVVVNLENVSVGLIVDSVNEVLDIPGERIDPPPAVRKGTESRYVQGLGKVDEDVKIILNINKLLFAEEFQEIAETANN